LHDGVRMTVEMGDKPMAGQAVVMAALLLVMGAALPLLPFPLSLAQWWASA
jgi:hypothetical protein